MGVGSYTAGGVEGSVLYPYKKGGGGRAAKVVHVLATWVYKGVCPQSDDSMRWGRQ